MLSTNKKMIFEEIPDEEAKTKIYKVRLLEKQSIDRAIPITHKFAVYREGISGETAFDLDGRYVPYFKENDLKFSAITDYLNGLSDIYGYRVNDYNREQEWGKAIVFLFVTDHIEEKYYFIYNDSGITHKEITVVI